MAIGDLVRTFLGRRNPHSEAPDPVDFRLANGLEVLLRPIPQASKTALVVLYRIGGNHDPAGRSGRAHLMEHLYVTAAAGSVTARGAEEWMRKNTGNAQTGEDYTLVAEMFAGSELPSRLSDAAARMSALRIEPSDLQRELPRMAAELANMYGGTPGLAAYNLARERVRPAASGGRRAGRAEELAQLTCDELREHYTRWYRPVNAILALAGGFDPRSARAEIEERFASLLAGEPAPAPAAPETPTAALAQPQIVRPTGAASGAEATLAFRAPTCMEDDYAPFLLLVARMLRQVGNLGGKLPGFTFPPPICYTPIDAPEVVTVSTSVRKNEDPAAAVARLDEFVAEVTGGAVSADDLKTLETQFGPMVGLISPQAPYWKHNPYAAAFLTTRWAQTGFDRAAFSGALSRVTPLDLNRCATAVFSPERRAAVVVSSLHTV